MNEVLLSDALRRAVVSETAPSYLCGDINFNPANSLAIAAAVDSGLLIDIGRERTMEVDVDEERNQRKIPENTNHNDGPTKGNRAEGAKIIDLILANLVAASSISTLRHR